MNSGTRNAFILAGVAFVSGWIAGQSKMRYKIRCMDAELEAVHDGFTADVEKIKEKYDRLTQEARDEYLAKTTEVVQALKDGVSQVDEFYMGLAEEAIAEAGKVDEAAAGYIREGVTLAKAATALTDYQALSNPTVHSETKAFLEPAVVPKPGPIPTQTTIEREYIDSSEYIESGTGYDQIELVYYAGDGVVLVSKTDRVMTSKEASLALGSFQAAFASQGAQSIYVRNHTIRTEFEITRVEGLYEVEVGDDDE